MNFLVDFTISYFNKHRRTMKFMIVTKNTIVVMKIIVRNHFAFL